MSIRIRVKRSDANENSIIKQEGIGIYEDSNFNIIPLNGNQTDQSLNQNIKIRIKQNNGPCKQTILNDISGFKILVSEKTKNIYEIEESPIKSENSNSSSSQSQIDSNHENLTQQLNSINDTNNSDPIQTREVDISDLNSEDIQSKLLESTKTIDQKEKRIAELENLVEKQNSEILDKQNEIKNLQQTPPNELNSLIRDQLTETLNQSQTESNRKLAASALKQEELNNRINQLETELNQSKSINESQQAIIDQLKSELLSQASKSAPTSPTTKDSANQNQQQATTPQSKGRRFSFLNKRRKAEIDDNEADSNLRKQLTEANELQQKTEKVNAQQKERITELEHMILQYEKLVDNQDPSTVNIEHESKLLNKLKEECEALQNDVETLAKTNTQQQLQVNALSQSLNDTTRQLDEIQTETRASKQLIKTYEESMMEANRRLVDFQIKHNELEQQLNAQIQQSQEICEQQKQQIHDLEQRNGKNVPEIPISPRGNDTKNPENQTKLPELPQQLSPRGGEPRRRKSSFRDLFNKNDLILPEKEQDDLIPAMKNLLKEEQKKNEELENKIKMLEYTLRQQSLQLKQKQDIINELSGDVIEEEKHEEEEIDEINQIRKIRDLNHTVAALQEEILSHMAELQKLRTENQEKDENFVNLTQKLKSTEHQLNESQQLVLVLQNSMIEANHKMTDLTQQKNELEASINEGTVVRSNSLTLNSDSPEKNESVDQSNSPSTPRTRRNSIRDLFAKKTSNEEDQS